MSDNIKFAIMIVLLYMALGFWMAYMGHHHKVTQQYKSERQAIEQGHAVEVTP